MKIIYKILFVYITGLMPAFLLAQTNSLDRMIMQYADQPGFYFIEMKTNMAGSFMGDSANPSAKKLITVKMLSFKEEEFSKYRSADIYDLFFAGIDKDLYRGIVEVKNSGDKVDMLVKKEKDQLEEVIVVVREESETTLIAVSGDLDLKKITKLSEIKKCNMFDTLQKLCEE